MSSCVMLVQYVVFVLWWVHSSTDALQFSWAHTRTYRSRELPAWAEAAVLQFHFVEHLVELGRVCAVVCVCVCACVCGLCVCMWYVCVCVCVCVAVKLS